jgi:hypothetical protein
MKTPHIKQTIHNEGKKRECDVLDISSVRGSVFFLQLADDAVFTLKMGS